MSNSTIFLYNGLHLGDQIFTCIFFYNIKNYIEKNNINIIYYIHEQYIAQVKEFIISPNITLASYQETGINVWIGNTEIRNNYFDNKNQNNGKVKLDIMLKEFFNNVADLLTIPTKMMDFSYTDEDLIIRYNNLNDKYKNLDVLIINSDCFSGQINMNIPFIDNMNKTIKNLNKRYKISTTKKLDNINCTTDEGLTIKTIAAISINCKIVIAINTGPIVGLLNTYTLENVRKIFILDNVSSYEHNKFHNIHLFSDIKNFPEIFN